MQPTKLATNTRIVVKGEAAQQAIKAGVQEAYDLALAAYGPDSGNVAIEAVYGDPELSHDGVFNLDHLHLPEGTGAYPLGTNMAARMVVQASRQTNQHVGDGTTAAVILASALYQEAKVLVANGAESRFSIARKLHDTAGQAIELIDQMKVKASPKLLQDAAIISASDHELGSLISDTIQEIGADGGVIIENFGGAGIYNDIASGFYFRTRGLTSAALMTDPSNLESRFGKVMVFVCDKELSNSGDILPILDKCVGAGIRELLLIGSVTTEALATAVKARIEGMITCTIVEPPDFAALRALFMDDVALYTGAKIMSAGSNPFDFNLDMLGECKGVVTEHATTLLDGDGDKKQIKLRTDQLREELSRATSPIEQEVVRTRLSRLTGKIAILRVGGATPAEQGEVKKRVEDAVAALQAAIKDGVVPGGGTTLARLAPTLPFTKAFEQPLKALLGNAGRNADRGLWHVQESEPWQGYDLRSDSEELVDLKKAGVVDPTLVIKEIVLNATSAAAELIKTTTLMPFDNREAKRG
jgi:chaperonin GroEL